MNQPERKLKINMIELESAFEHRDAMMEISYFLDLETGKIVMTTSEEEGIEPISVGGTWQKIVSSQFGEGCVLIAR